MSDGCARTPLLSLILPVLNEATTVVAQLTKLQVLRARGAELLVVDGGSNDGTAALAAAGADRLLDAPRGRALQMNAGARASRGDVLLFVHADTTLPPDAEALIRAAIAGGAVWGRFDVSIDGRHPLLPLVAAMMNWRSRWTGIATGDQAMFVRRDAFLAVGAFPEVALMEDIALSRRLKAVARPACLRARVRTSGRRWEQHGVLRTIVLMWRLRASYFLGADPAQLALRYGYSPRQP